MKENKIMQQITAIFSLFMVFFYMGVGIFFIFYSEQSYLDKAVRNILGFTMIFYGLYRAYRTYNKIVEVFFTHNRDEE